MEELKRYDVALKVLQSEEWFTSRFDISTIEFLGKGSFGAVFSIFHIKFKKNLAVKLIESTPNELNEISSELVRMKSLNHPNIIEILEHFMLIKDDVF